MKRYELLEKANKGEFNKGDKFKSELGAVVTFDGKYFRFHDGEKLSAMVSNIEWEKHEKKVTVELTEAQLNTIMKMSVYVQDRDIERNLVNIPHVSTWDILRLAQGELKKIDGGTK